MWQRLIGILPPPPVSAINSKILVLIVILVVHNVLKLCPKKKKNAKCPSSCVVLSSPLKSRIRRRMEIIRTSLLVIEEKESNHREYVFPNESPLNRLLFNRNQLFLSLINHLSGSSLLLPSSSSINASRSSVKLTEEHGLSCSGRQLESLFLDSVHSHTFFTSTTSTTFQQNTIGTADQLTWTHLSGRRLSLIKKKRGNRSPASREARQKARRAAIVKRKSSTKSTLTLSSSSSSSFASSTSKTLSVSVFASGFVVRQAYLLPFRFLNSLERREDVAKIFRLSFEPYSSRSSLGLSSSSYRLLNEPNAGGSSELSEAFSFEILMLCFGAQLWMTEMQIEYWWSNSKKTDYSVLLSGHKLGISVTRAIKFGGSYTEEDAFKLLSKKLKGIELSDANVIEPHAWEQQALFVWTPTVEIAEITERVFRKMNSTTLVVVVTSNRSDWLYENMAQSPPLFCSSSSQHSANS
eukprot:TRINITY_DN1250_c3_g1_i1.p1 TRINITY_DN1250_c3_g1~~TRINITY_DN1250_c3_g1_i1.p1  ORF type:complete len:466 (-),score=110.66 TRINITY_DN1250_c3_g1_i1:22-1419(-)